MSQVYRLLDLIADGNFHSGEELGKTLGITRSAIWKIVKQLIARGLDIYCVRGRGYRLSDPVELLDQEKILSVLDEGTRAKLNKLEVLTEVKSTNQYLMERVSKGLASGTACLAEHQTASYGRRGRTWLSSVGHNVYLSMSWHFSTGAAGLSGLSLAVGIAVARVLKLSGLPDVAVKWPNDLLCQDKKIAGILLEVVGDAAGPCDVVIGVGLNVMNPRDERFAQIDQPWTDMAGVLGSKRPSRNRLAAAMMAELINVLGDFEQNGLENLMSEWQQVDALRGSDVQINVGNEQIEGIVKGIDEQGSLLVEQDGQVKAFRGGEVSVKRFKREQAIDNAYSV